MMAAGLHKVAAGLQTPVSAHWTLGWIQTFHLHTEKDCLSNLLLCILSIPPPTGLIGSDCSLPAEFCVACRETASSQELVSDSAFRLLVFSSPEINPLCSPTSQRHAVDICSVSVHCDPWNNFCIYSRRLLPSVICSETMITCCVPVKTLFYNACRRGVDTDVFSNGFKCVQWVYNECRMHSQWVL